MNNSTSYFRASLLSLALLFVFSSCTNIDASDADADDSVEKAATSQTTMVDITAKPSPEDVIPLDTFKTWTHNWDSLGRIWMDTAVITAFNMPLVDLREVLGEAGVDSSRFYLGLEQKEKGYTAKMVVVGVNAEGEDMLDYAKGQFAYDVSKPCPPVCGKAAAE